MQFCTFIWTLLLLSTGIYCITGDRKLLNRNYNFIKNLVSGTGYKGNYTILDLVNIMLEVELIDKPSHTLIVYDLSRIQTGSLSRFGFDQNKIRVMMLYLRYRQKRGCDIINRICDNFMMGRISLKAISCVLLHQYVMNILKGYSPKEVYDAITNQRQMVRSIIHNFDHFKINSVAELDKISNL